MWLFLPALALAGVPEPGARGSWPRPALSGTASTVDSDDGFFRVHYTHEGIDAVPTRDEDGSGRPDYVERVLAALDFGRARYAEDGWRPPVGDLGLGGSTALDVYLRGVDINGYAYPLEGEAAEGGYACFIELDPALPTQGNILESIAVHELHHCVEYRYGTTASWLHEGSATAAQYALYSDLSLQLAVNVLWNTRLSQPELAVDDRSGNYEYAAFTFFKHWADDLGPPPEFWTSLADEGGEDWRAHVERAAADAGYASFAEAFLRFELDLAFACALDDDAHWAEDSLACTSEASLPVEALPADATSLVSAHTDAPYTATFHELPADGSTDALALSCEGAELGLALAAIDGEGRATEEIAVLGGEAALTMAVAPDGAFRLVVASFAEQPREVACTLTRIAPTADTGEPTPAACGCRSARGAGWLWLIGLAALGRPLSSRSSDRR